ncbi:MAG: PKD domain-containing protein [Saprospiraceae bacterium]|nr:PKD domain-containing protein [Saprospiraceae bacterium]
MTTDTVSFTNISTNGIDYNWDFGDGNSSSDDNPTHIYSDTGTYTVVLVVTDSCGYSDTTQQNIVIAPITTGVPLMMNALSQFKVYPNPAQDQLTVEAQVNIQAIQLVDALGRMVYVEKAITEQKINLTTTTYPRGLYFLGIQTQDGILYSQQIILE